MPLYETPVRHGIRTESANIRRASRGALLCALITAACLLASYPIAEIGFVDDWSYIKTTLDFARTGHFLYNGGGFGDAGLAGRLGRAVH